MKNLPPISNTFTETIASTQYEFVNSLERHPVTVEIGKPIHDVVCVNSIDWRCPLRIKYLNKESIRNFMGVDSAQALFCVKYEIIEPLLLSIAKKYSYKLFFLGEEVS
jgi:hypothetical protein